MCTHFRSYLQGAQFTLRTDHSSLRWLEKFRNEDGMLARWFMLLGQFSVTLEYRPGAQHVNVDRMSRQCGQCQRPDCWYPLPIRGWLNWTPRQCYWISHTPRQKWVISWKRICCWSCLGKPGWQLHYWKDLQRICLRLDRILTLLWHIGRM